MLQEGKWLEGEKALRPEDSAEVNFAFLSTIYSSVGSFICEDEKHFKDKQQSQDKNDI